MDDSEERQSAEMMAMRLMLAQTMAFVANQQDDRELWVSNMRDAALRSLDYSLNLSTPDTKISPIRRVREIAEKTIIDTFDVIGRASG